MPRLKRKSHTEKKVLQVTLKKKYYKSHWKKSITGHIDTHWKTYLQRFYNQGVGVKEKLGIYLQY